MEIAGLFAGIGGIELGLGRAGHETAMLCEVMEPAQAVLAQRFPTTDLVGDVRDVRSLPRSVDVVTAGFPCTDISQAGRTAGIFGEQSGLVDEVFRIIRRRYPTYVVFENVSFLLQLGRGAGMRHIVAELEAMKMRWAYRVVDSRFSGVPQRRRRVIIVASRTEDPRDVLFVDDAGDRGGDYAEDAFGFYWTEGLRGLGWAQDAVPTLKGGSTIGIPSPPGIWDREADPGRRFIKPTVNDGEVLQGFPRGWTDAAAARTRDPRWKLVGNAVTVGVAEWIGRRLACPGEFDGPSVEVERWPGSWPTAGWGEGGRTFDVSWLSEFPEHVAYRHLLDVVDRDAAPVLTNRGAAGFLGRANRAKLRFDDEFLADMREHVELTTVQPSLLAG